MWKNLKSYFILEEEGAKKAPVKATLPDHRKHKQSTPPVSTTTNSPDPVSTEGSSPSAGGKISDRFVEILLQAMESANLPGFDYLEYKKSLQNLEKMNFDDATRFQTAYAAAQSMGVTSAQLLDSANHYLDVLKKEENKFSAALKNQRNDQIARKEQRLKQLDGSIKEQEAKIEEIEQRIAKTKSEQQKLSKDIQNSSKKIAITKADFEKTYQTIAGSIGKDVDKMKEYLK